MTAVPLPGAGQDVVQLWVPGPPSQVPVDLVRRGHEARRVTGSAWGDLGGDRVTGDAPRGFDDFADGVPRTIAEVVDLPRAVVESLQGQQVCADEVGDVDIVTNAGAVRSRIVVSEDVGRTLLTESDLEDARNEVTFRVVSLAPPAGG